MPRCHRNLAKRRVSHLRKFIARRRRDSSLRVDWQILFRTISRLFSTLHAYVYVWWNYMPGVIYTQFAISHAFRHGYFCHAFDYQVISKHSCDQSFFTSTPSRRLRHNVCITCISVYATRGILSRCSISDCFVYPEQRKTICKLDVANSDQMVPAFLLRGLNYSSIFFYPFIFYTSNISWNL